MFYELSGSKCTDLLVMTVLTLKVKKNPKFSAEDLSFIYFNFFFYYIGNIVLTFSLAELNSSANGLRSSLG